jgi:LacI family transcriptional regulator
MTKKTTLQDIATAAGVSLTTASFALAGKGGISPVVQRKVQRIAKEFGYVSRNYQAKKNLTTCAVLMDTGPQWAHVWNFLAPILNSLEDELKQNRCFSTLLPVDKTDQTLIKRLEVMRCNAVFSLHYFNREIFKELEKQGIPVVIVNNSEGSQWFSTVCSDDYQGAYDGTRHLLDYGHRKILFMDYERPSMPDLLTDRFVGFKKALDEADVSFPANQKLMARLHSPDSIREKLAPFVDKMGKFSAIFAHDDYLATQIIHVLNERGLSVPDDISIIAPGDVLDYSDLSSHRISTMKIDTASMGQFAAQLMLNRLNNPNTPQQTLKVSQNLINRNSCRLIPL